MQNKNTSYLVQNVSLFVEIEQKTVHCGQPLACKAKLKNHGCTTLVFGENTSLAYHWFKHERLVVWDGLRTPLPSRLAPGDEISLDLSVAAPPISGDLHLHFGIVQEAGEWWHDFSIDSTHHSKVSVLPATEGTSPHFALNKQAAVKVLQHGIVKPVSLVCETINICNNLCIFCAYTQQTRIKGVMSLQLFKQVLEQYAAIGGGELSFTSIGEVLLDPLLEQRLELVAQNELISAVSATTNATIACRISEQKLSAIIPHFDTLQISIYGLSESESLHITAKQRYIDMIAGIKRILGLATGKLLLAFRTASSRDEIDVWIESHFDLSATKADVEIHGPVICYGNFSTLDTTEPPYHGASWRPNNPDKLQCLFPAAALKIFWNGNVSLCPCADYDNTTELNLGNIRHAHLKQILNSTKYKNLWNWAQHGVPKFCQNCTHYISLDDAINIHGVFQQPRLIIGA